MNLMDEAFVQPKPWTVQQLIWELEKLPKDLPVVICLNSKRHNVIGVFQSIAGTATLDLSRRNPEQNTLI